MSFLFGECFVIQEEEPQACSCCGVIVECRPRGNGKPVCSSCCSIDKEMANEVWERQDNMIKRSKFCLQVPKGIKVTAEMVEEARRKAFG